MFLFDEISKRQGAVNQQMVIVQKLNNHEVIDGDTYAGDYVIGVLQNDFDYTVTAEYDQMFDGIIEQAPGVGLLRKAYQLGGKPLGSSGIFKRKIYKGGSHLTFTVDFRIVSDGYAAMDELLESGAIANTKTAASWLADLCLPVKGPTFESVYDMGKSKLDSITTSAGVNYQAGAEYTGRMMAGMLESLKGSGFPNTIRIKIGNKFESSDMIVESVNIKYSKENIFSKKEGAVKGHVDNMRGAADLGHLSKSNLEDYQPLYVDISMTVSTATVPNKGNTGLLAPQPKVSVASSIAGVTGTGDFGLLGGGKGG